MKIESPCKDCKDRCAGCSVTCDKWKEYVTVRNQGYKIRADQRAYFAYRAEHAKFRYQ